MRYTLRHAVAAVAVLSLLLICGRAGFADDADGVATVRVKFLEGGETELDIVNAGVSYNTGETDGFKSFPEELSGLTFTRRHRGQSPSVTIDAPAGATIYLILGDGGGAATGGRKAALALGWKQDRCAVALHRGVERHAGGDRIKSYAGGAAAIAAG